MVVETIFIIFILLIVVGLLLFFAFIYFRLKVEKKNEAIIINFASKRANNRFIGLLKEIKIGRGNRKLITYIPKDVDVEKKSENEVKIIVDKLIEMPRGISGDREIKILLPKNSEELPDGIKNTEFGKWVSNYIEETNTQNTIVEALREDIERKNKLFIISGSGELSEEEIERQRELFNKLKDVTIKDVERERYKPI